MTRLRENKYGLRLAGGPAGRTQRRHWHGHWGPGARSGSEPQRPSEPGAAPADSESVNVTRQVLSSPGPPRLGAASRHSDHWHCHHHPRRRRSPTQRHSGSAAALSPADWAPGGAASLRTSNLYCPVRFCHNTTQAHWSRRKTGSAGSLPAARHDARRARPAARDAHCGPAGPGRSGAAEARASPAAARLRFIRAQFHQFHRSSR